MRALSEDAAGAATFLIIAGSVEVITGEGAKDKSVGALDAGNVFRPNGSFVISYHADEVFFSRWTVLFARLEAPFAVAQARAELGQTEPRRDHARDTVVDFGDLDFCRTRRVHARGLGTRVDADLPRT